MKYTLKKINKIKLNNLRHTLLVVTLSLLCGLSLQAQVNTQGTEFWVSFGKNTQREAKYMNFGIRVSTTNATKVWINYTSSGKNTEIDLPAGTIYTYYVPDDMRNIVYASQNEGNVYEHTSSNSLRITSEEPISLYAFNMGWSSSDATNVLPVTALGKEYYHLSYAAKGAGRDGYIVIAAEDNTVVKENGTTKATLQKGQVFSHFPNYVNTPDFTGVHVTADKPVAYFVSNESADVPETAAENQRNALFQQLAPVNQWGKRFFVPVTGEGKERVRVFSSQNGTNLTIAGGTVVTTVGKGSTYNLYASEFVELEIVSNKTNHTGGCYIESNNPIAVTSYMMSWGQIYPTQPSEDDKGAPSLCWIPPLEQSIKNATISVLNAINPEYSQLVHHNAIITTRTADKGLTTMAIGTEAPHALSGGTWYDHPTSGYSFYLLPLTNTTSTYFFANTNSMIVYAYGTGHWESYQYTAGSGTRSLDLSFYVNNIHYEDLDGYTFCGISNLVFRTECYVLPSTDDTYPRWYFNDEEDLDGRGKAKWNKTMSYGTYTVRFEYKDYSDNIHERSTTFSVRENSATAADILGQDVSVCYGAVTDLNTLVVAPDVINPVFRWYYAESGVVRLPMPPVVSSTKTRTYYVSVEGDNYCEGEANASGRKKITLYANSPATVANITGPDDTTIYSGSDVTLTASSNGVTEPAYFWYNTLSETTPFYIGESYTTPELDTDTEYYVSVAGINFCEGDESVRRKVTVTVKPNIINVETCEGQTVTLTATPINAGASPTFQWVKNDVDIDNETSSTYSYIPQNGDMVYCKVTSSDPCAYPTTATSLRYSITFKQKPVLTQPENLTFCHGENVPLIAFTGTNLETVEWEVASNLGTAIGMNVNSDTGNILGFVTNNITDMPITAVVTVTPKSDAGCEGEAKTFTITVNPRSGETDIIVSNITICDKNSVNLNDLVSSNNVTNPEFMWYTTIDGDIPMSFTIVTPPVGTHTYYVSVKGDNYCESAINMRKEVTVTVDPIEKPSVIMHITVE